MIRVRRIETTDPLYEQELALRRGVLLEPLGLDLSRLWAEFPGLEERAEHHVALVDHPSGATVVGCALLLVDHPEPGVGKLMQMAVHPQRQGEGIGRRLIVQIESRAFGEYGLHTLFCHARQSACGFYRRVGWQADSDPFDELGIPHRRMVLRQPEQGQDDAGG